jgi:hypothetical protein
VLSLLQGSAAHPHGPGCAKRQKDRGCEGNLKSAACQPHSSRNSPPEFGRDCEFCRRRIRRVHFASLASTAWTQGLLASIASSGRAMRRMLHRLRGSVQRERPESITPRDWAETTIAAVEVISLRHQKSPATGCFPELRTVSAKALPAPLAGSGCLLP